MNKEGTEYRGDRELSSNAMQEIVEERKSKIKIITTEIEDIQDKIEKIKYENGNETDKKELKKIYTKLNLKKDKVVTLQSDIRKYEVEIHKKYAIAFACVIFVLIGAPIGMMTKTSGVGMSFSVSAIVFLIYYGALTLGEELADKGIVSPFLAMWISNIVFCFIGIYLVVISVREMRTLDLSKIKNSVSKLLGINIK
jgi:lipopolysaccharide export system permease protein